MENTDYISETCDTEWWTLQHDDSLELCKGSLTTLARLTSMYKNDTSLEEKKVLIDGKVENGT